MINLLPPKYKEELKNERNITLVFILEILLLTFFLSLSLVLFAIRINIQGLVDEQNVSLESKNKEVSQLAALEKKSASLNKELSNLEVFYKNRLDLTDFLERVSRLSPEGMYLNSFSYQKDLKQINLSGFAPTVGSLLEFKENLENQKEFKEINFPTAVWLQSINIDFNVSFKVVEE